MPRAGFPRELLQAAQSERLGYFRAYTIAHPRLKAVSDALWRAIQEPAGRALILVIGPTGVGKTTLRLRMEQELQQRFLAAGASEPGRIPVVGVEAVAPDSGTFSWKEYYRRALRALEEPLIDDKIDYATSHRFRNHAGEFTVPPRVGNPELRQAMEQALRHRRPVAVLIDEAQHVTKMASGRRLADQVDCLKSLASLTGCVHVLIGTYELLPCRNLSAQLSRRSIDLHFQRYQVDNPDDIIAFQRVIFSFQRHLPLPQEPELWRDWEYYYAQSIGCVGILKDWFTRALAEALAQGALTLTRAALARHAWSLEQCEKMAQDAVDGEAVLADQPEAMERLRTLLGLEAAPRVDTGSPRSNPPLKRATPGRERQPQGRRRVGGRRPGRDVIGMGGTD
jgi:hypothetical protein